MKIDATSMGKIQGLIMAVMVGIFAVPFGLILALTDNAGVGLAVMVGAPLVYGIFGFIGGAIGAKVFSLAAGKVGGLIIEMETQK